MRSTTGDGIRHARSLLLLCVLAFGVASSQESGRLFLVNAQQQTGTVPPQATATRQQIVTLEFDAPAEFAARDATGRPTVGAFQVGFFAGSRLVRAVEIPRDSARVTAGKIRLNVPLGAVTSSKDSSVVLKVRALSSGRLGPWSDTAGSVTLPVQDASKRRGRADTQAAAKSGAGQTPSDDRQPADAAKNRRAARRGSARQLGVADIERHEALKTLVTQSLDSSITLEQAVGSFAKVQDLATAALLARKLMLPFAKLCAAVDAAPKRSLVEGLKALQPSINAQAEIKLVVRDARKLVGRQRPQRPQTPAAR